MNRERPNIRPCLRPFVEVRRRRGERRVIWRGRLQEEVGYGGGMRVRGRQTDTLRLYRMVRRR